jgi:hypothetical protein
MNSVHSQVEGFRRSGNETDYNDILVSITLKYLFLIAH